MSTACALSPARHPASAGAISATFPTRWGSLPAAAALRACAGQPSGPAGAAAAAPPSGPAPRALASPGVPARLVDAARVGVEARNLQLRSRRG
jgi:hypothetical protein